MSPLSKSLPSRTLAAVLSCQLALAPAFLGARAFAAAPAAGPPKLAVIAFPLDDAAIPAAARLGSAGEQIAKRLARQKVLDVADLLDPENAAARAERGKQGQADYQAARKAYDDLDVGRAADLCGRALEQLEKADVTTQFDALVRAWVLKVAALIANAEHKQAFAELALLLTIDPKPPFDPNLFAPDFLAQVRRERDELARKSNQPLDIQSRPVPARVYLDGVFRGVTPLELRNLAPGDHLLTAIAPGYQRLQRRVRPGVGMADSLALTPASRHGLLTQAAVRVRADLRGEGRNRAARELGRELGAAQVLLMAVSSRNRELKVLATRIDVADGHELAYAEERLPDEEARFQAAAEAFLERVLGRDLQRSKATTGGGFEWTSRYTGFALLGLGVGAAVVGSLFGLAARTDANHYKERTEVQTAPIYTALESSGRRNALGADISFLGALILGGTGAFLAATGRSPAGADEANPNIEERKTVAGVRSREDEEAKPDTSPGGEAGPKAAPGGRSGPSPEPGTSKRSSADEGDDLRDDR
jgi:hypothetical protein